MAKHVSESRRKFLKTSVAGATGLLVGSAAVKQAKAAWTTGMKINPNIDNLRVVCCYDTNMLLKTPTSWSFANQNSAVFRAQVAANLDEMAKKLANTATAAAAWAIIFQKPAKGWSAAKVAIKVNCINTAIMPRLAIVDKICRVLNTLGVPYGNIIIYDGCSNAKDSKIPLSKYNGYIGTQLPTGVVVLDGNGPNGTVSAAVPGVGNVACTADVANGVYDILVNCAVNKGHGDAYGTCTLTMKNHFGTFNPNSVHSTKGVLGISKSDAIIGGTPPRQQLCIVDSLFAAIPGPGNSPDVTPPARLVMGTFSPAVDYLTVKKIREQVMGATHDATNVARFLTDFGYTAAQLTDFVTVTPAPKVGIVEEPVPVIAGNHIVEISLPGSRFKPEILSFRLPTPTSSSIDVSILDIKGNLVLKIPSHSGLRIFWNGRDSGGTIVSAGKYVAKVVAPRFAKSLTFTVAG